MDGSIFASARATERNIVLTLILLPIPSIESVRQKTYSFFPIKKAVTLLVETDNRLVETTGYVESNEPTSSLSRSPPKFPLSARPPLL